MTIGHNSISAERLKSFIGRIERIEDEQRGLTADKREIYKEAKSDGFDTKTLRALIKRRRVEASDLAEQEALLETYLSVIGEP